MMKHAQAREFLAEHSWLSATPDEFRRAVVNACRYRWYENGETVAHAGSDSVGIFAVVSGSLAATSVRGPKDAKLSYIMRPGIWSGMVPLFTGRPRIVDHVARGPTLIAHLDGPAIDKMVGQNPGWWRHFGYLATVLGELVTGFASDLLILDSRRRCIAALLHIANVRWVAPTSDPIDVEVSQEELAAIGGLSRKTAGRVLKDLEGQGLVELGYRSIRMIKPALFRQIADGD